MADKMTAQTRAGGRHCASERGAYDDGMPDPTQHPATAKLAEVARMDSDTWQWLAEMMGQRKAA